MARKRSKRRSVFIIIAAGYALIAAVVSWMLGDRLNEGMSSLILFGLVPVVLAAWIADAIRTGEMWRQGARSVTAGLTMNERRVTRKNQPVQFWLTIWITAALALAVFAFVIIGIYILLSLKS